MKPTERKSPRPRRSSRKNPPDIKATEKEFPGYPHYNPDEDILKQAKRVDTDIEVVPAQDANKVSRVEEIPQPSIDDQADEPATDPYTVTEEDLQALGSEELSMDGGDDEQLRKRKTPVDFTGDGLDVPGSELDDAEENVGSEDEENNSYSLGGDNHNDLEEDRS